MPTVIKTMKNYGKPPFKPFILNTGHIVPYLLKLNFSVKR